MSRQVSTRTIVILMSLTFGSGITAAPVGNVTQERVLAESGTGDNWFLNGGDFSGQHYSPLTEINDDNVESLGLAWFLDLPSPDGISATPIVVDGAIYLSAPQSVVFAIDAASGKHRWIYDPDLRSQFQENPSLYWRSRTNRGVALWEGKVFVAVADCRLVALDAGTGRQLWSVVTCNTEQGYGISDAPRVGGGKVFIGNAGSESGQKNRGYVSAYDVDDGELLWRFFTVPSDDPAENTSPEMQMAADTWSGDVWQEFGGGGSAWNEMTYDPDSNLLFFGTAGALPYLHKQRNPEGGDNLFTSSVLAVNAETGAYVWHYQTVPHDNWDYNANMNIVLAELTIEGKLRKVAMIAPKNGFFYVLDRLSGELISADNYAKVNWATDVNLETGRPEPDRAGQFWELAVGETTAIWPNMWGAHSWHPMAYHPGHELVYIPVIDVPQIVTILPDDDFNDTVDVIDNVDGKPHAPGKLLAWDPVTQCERWSVGHQLPVNGGVLATAGNLVFQGNAMGEFVAYDAANGMKLWSVVTGTAINAAPVSYRLDGSQYVLVPAGAGGVMQFWYPDLHAGKDIRGPTRLFAFRLHGRQSMPATEVPRRKTPILPELQATAETLESGADLYVDNCEGCHGKGAAARFGGTASDLRYASAATHDQWQRIVIGGARKGMGMPEFKLSAEEGRAIQAYVVAQARKLQAE